MSEENKKITITKTGNSPAVSGKDVRLNVTERPRMEADKTSHGRAERPAAIDNVKSANEISIKDIRTGAGKIKLERFGQSGAMVARAAITSMLLSGQTEASAGLAYTRTAVDVGMMGVEFLNKRTANTLAKDATSIVNGRDGLGLRTASRTDLEKIKLVSQKHGLDLQFKSAFSTQDMERINRACEKSGLEKIQFREMGKKEVRSFLNGEGGNYLKEKGIIKSAGGNGFGQHYRSIIPGIKARDKLSAFDAKLLAAYKRQGLANGMGAKKGGLRHGRMLRTILKHLKKCEAGQGLSLSVTTARYTRKLAMLAKKSLASAARGARSAAKIAYIAAEKLALAAKSERLAALMRGRADKITVKAEAKLTKKLMKREKGLRARINRLRQKVKNKLFSPFKKFYKKLKNKLLRTRLGKAASALFKRFNFLNKFFAYIRGVIASFFSVLSTVFAYVIGIALASMIASVLISIFISQFSSNESVSSGPNETVTEACLEKLGERHTEFLTKDVQSAYTTYNGTVTITTEDVKDQPVYDNLNLTSEIEETTNLAEIMSMAMVRFDYDLDGAEEDEVEAYLMRLYNASHELVIDTTDRQVPTGTDDEGNTTYTTVTDANITVRTYYFDEIFSRDLSATTVTTVTNANEATRSIIEFLKGKGMDDIHIAAILGVYAGEMSTFDPTTVETVFDEPFQVGPKGKKYEELDFIAAKCVPSYKARFPKIHRLGIGFGAWTDTTDMKEGLGANTQLRKFAESQGKPWYDMGVQLDYWWNGTPALGKESSYEGWHGRKFFESAKTLDMAAFYYYTMRVNGWNTGNPVPSKRMNAAREYLRRLQSGDFTNIGG